VGVLPTDPGVGDFSHMSEPRPYRVLVVCTGNTCRTPIAEALLRQLTEEAGIDAEVVSAGTHATPGWPAHPESQAVAAEAGLDLSDHQAQPLTVELVQWADIVLGMSHGHVAHALALDDTADVRVITEFDRGGQIGHGVGDPIGWGRKAYEIAFTEIRVCLEGFVEDHLRRLSTG